MALWATDAMLEGLSLLNCFSVARLQLVFF